MTLNNLKDRSMATNSSRLPLTLAATHSGAGKEGFAHIWRDEFQARIPPLILDLSVNISRLVSLLEGSSSDPAQNSEDLTALGWIHRSLEDVEATIIGLSEIQRRRAAAFRDPAPSGSLVP